MARSHSRLWKLGIDFKDAWILVSSEEEIQQIQRSGVIQYESAGDGGKQLTVFFGLVFNSQKELLEKGKRLLEKKRELLLGDLFNSELFAFSRNQARQYPLVPHKFWDFAEPDWLNNSAYDTDASFHDLRVCTYEQGKAVAPLRDRGRPSLEIPITNIIRNIYDDDPELIFGPSHKEIALEIIRRAETLVPNYFKRIKRADEKTFRNYVNAFKDSFNSN